LLFLVRVSKVSSALLLNVRSPNIEVEMLGARNKDMWKILKLHIGKKDKAVTGLEWPRGFQENKVPRFHDNGT